MTAWFLAAPRQRPRVTRLRTKLLAIRTRSEKLTGFNPNNFLSCAFRQQHTTEVTFHLVFLFVEILLVEVESVIDDFGQFGSHLRAWYKVPGAVTAGMFTQ